MAKTSYGVNHPYAVKLWAKKLFHETIGEDFYGKFMGEGTENLFQVRPELSKGGGDTIYTGLRALLEGDGVAGDSTLEGTGEALIVYRDSFTVDQLRHNVESQGKMSEQRVPFSVREEGRSALKDWWTERMNVVLANQLTGNTAQTDLRFTGGNATIAPSTAGGITRFVLGGGHAAETSFTASTTNCIKLSDLDRCVALAKTQRPRIRKVGGLYHCFLHTYAIHQLRQDVSTVGNFFDLQKANIQGGKYENNPLIKGGSFIYNDVVVHDWDYLPIIVGTPATGARADYRRGVFCGAQSLAFGYGRGGGEDDMTWVEELFDYKNQLGIAAGMIFGAKKIQFNSIDYGQITLAGWAPTP